LTRAAVEYAGQQRGTLQRVSYAMVDDVLKRSYQESRQLQPQSARLQDLFTRVKAVQLPLPQTATNLADPVAAAGTAVDTQLTRPVAVELIIEFEGLGADSPAHRGGGLSARRRQRGSAHHRLILVALPRFSRRS